MTCDIPQGALRIGRMGSTERNGQQFPATQWMHATCFFSVDAATASELNGSASLPSALKKELEALLKKAGKAAGVSSSAAAASSSTTAPTSLRDDDDDKPLKSTTAPAAPPLAQGSRVRIDGLKV